ncbi:MAG: type II toxin-antitoxin system HicA family toxin [Chloroflexi bacterium]|nr:type II toxin-antitoxin system HicA family toxin [Chloroflexota bacterium]
MSRLTPLKSSEVVRKLRQLGYDGPIPGGRHMRMVHPESGQIIPIPVHSGKDISVGLIREIIRQVGITRDEWLAL